jgi:phospholipid/cholesterol/gamma-HCH transport system substrate-binding protein
MLTNREFGKTTLEDLQGALAHVRSTSQQLDQILGRVDRGEGAIGRLLRDSKESRDIVGGLSRSAQSLEHLTHRLEHGRGAAGRLFEDEKYGDRLLQKLDRATADLSEVAAKLNNGDGTLGKLINDPSLYQDMQGLVHDVRTSWLVRLYKALHVWPSGGGGQTPESSK